MKKLTLLLVLLVIPVTSNAWVINEEIQRRWYPEYVNLEYEYNRIREFISDMEMNLYLIYISKWDRNKIMEIQDMGYMIDKKEIIKNIKTLLKELKQFNYLIKK